MKPSGRPEQTAGLDLPPPDPAALAISRTVSARIAAEIDDAGPMSLERFWEWALYAPGLGYYSNGCRKFGADGDFVTAPELGAVFGRCLAQPLAQVLGAMAGDGQILELGGGTGALAATLLQQLDDRGVPPREYAILEISADLRERQRHTLAPWLDQVRWLEQPPANDWRGVLLANEVVDALPARRFRRAAGGWQELRIDRDQDGFHWVARPVEAADGARLELLVADRDLPRGYVTEYQPRLGAWLTSVAGRLQEGLALFVDYGYPRGEYYHPQRGAGTLIAHYRHRAHEDILRWPGIQDLSVSVDFSALAEAVETAGLEVLGYTTQAQFLLASGLADVLDEAGDMDERERLRLLHQIKMLTLPAEMGERFKVLAAGRGLAAAPAGFAQDQRERL